MGLPQQVQAQQDRSNALIAQMQQARAANANTPPAVPQPAPVPAAAPTPSAPAAVADTEQTWEQRYKALRGKYDAEVPRLSSQLREAGERITALTEQVTTLQADIEAAKKATPPAPDPLTAELDPDLVAAMRKVAGDAVAPLAPVIERMAKKDEAAERAEREASQRDGFIAALSDLVPDWQALDEEPGFAAFLAEPGDNGEPRELAFKAAIRSFDAVNAARTFLRYRASRKPASTATPDLASQVVPGQAGSASVPGVAQKRQWKQSEITGFYNSITRGQLTDPDLIRRTEQDILDARLEGRIVPG